MKIFQKILFLIALLFLVLQTARHVYYRFIQPRTSVLDQFQPPVVDEITKARSLGELVAKYKPALQAVKEFEKGKTKEELKEFDHSTDEPYRTADKLKEAINDWEQHSKTTLELRFYWFVGLGVLLIGLFCWFRVSQWLGLSLVITSFSEIIYWTSPTFISSTLESDRLLTQKIIFSIISIPLLLLVAWLMKILSNASNSSLASGKNDVPKAE